MNLYITFGYGHVHEFNGQFFNHDVVARIKCKDYADGRRIAFELFGDKFCTSYTEDQLKLEYFPRGIIDAN